MELIPTAKMAIISEHDPKVKLTCLSLFRKILGQPDLSSSYIGEFVPLILTLLNETSTDFRLESESLQILTEMAQMEEASEFERAVIKAASRLLGHRKRVVRKFARVCLNAWASAN